MKQYVFGIVILATALAFPVSIFAVTCDEHAQSQCTIQVDLGTSFLKEVDTDITRVAVGDPNVAEVRLITPRQIMIIGSKKPGRTNLILWRSESDAMVFDIDVRVSDAMVAEFREELRKIVPEADIEVIQSKKSVILKGEVESQEILDRVIQVTDSHVKAFTNLMTVRGSRQVQLEVHIAEVSRSGMKQMGLGFLYNNATHNVGLFPNGSVSGASSGRRDIRPETVTQTHNELTGESSTITTSGGLYQNLNSGMELSSPFGSAFQIAVHAIEKDTLGLLSMLKGQNLAKILASPTLVAMSGQEAEFMVGGEFPIPVNGMMGTTGVQYKRFGIMLRFKPVLIGKETMTLRVEPEVSNVDYSIGIISGGAAVPALKTRRGMTTLQLKDGQTFVMAGLLKEEVYSVESRLPYLGDIPILGSLFTSKGYGRDETELMVIVTPRLVRALNADEVPALPGQTISGTVSDTDFFLMNRTLRRKHDRLANKAANATKDLSDEALTEKKGQTADQDAFIPRHFIGRSGFAE